MDTDQEAWTDVGASRARRTASAAPWLAACVLAVGAGVVHQWQTTRIGVLGDFAYIVDTAWRIAQGEVMYRDFALPHSPLTFHVQATLIKLFGFSYRLTVWYCTAVNAAYVLLTYRLLRVLSPPWSAVGLCLPLVLLAPHCIYPHPFYDPDACLLILLNLNLLHWVTTARVSPVVVFLCGMTTVLPALAKQNMGYPYLGLVGLGVLWWGWLRDMGRAAGGDGAEAAGARATRWFMYGILGGCAVTLGWLAATCGIENYLLWVFVSASRRLAQPTLQKTYGDWSKWANGLVLVAGWHLWGLQGAIALPTRLDRASAVLLLGPFVGVVALTFLTGPYFLDDFDHPVLLLWTPAMLLAFVAGAWRMRRPTQATLLVTTVLPWLCLTVTFFSFLSQTHLRSSYGIWALLLLMIGGALSALPESRLRDWVCWGVGLMVALSAMPYVRENIRLRYIDQRGEMLETVSGGPLRGFSAPEPYLSEYAELLQFVKAYIPQDDPVVCVPQEDPFYVMTRRKNPLSIVIFDRTANPFSPAEVLEAMEKHGVAWVILKQHLQMGDPILEEISGLPELIQTKYVPVKQLRGYLILYRAPLPTSASPERRQVAPSTP